MSEHTAENDAPTCPHAHVESWQKFGGTVLWRCLDCGTDSRDDESVIPPGVASMTPSEDERHAAATENTEERNGR